MGDRRMKPAPQEALSKLVRKALVDKGSSLKELAGVLHTSYQNLHGILSGETRLTLSDAKRIADYLNLSVDDLARAEETGRAGMGEAGESDKESMIVMQERQFTETGPRMEMRGIAAQEPPLPSFHARRNLMMSFGAPPTAPSAPGTERYQNQSAPNFTPTPDPDSASDLRDEQALSVLLRLFEEGKLPENFYRVLAEKLRPYLEDQEKND